ncbi:MAG: KpsF/GutQ family sugar-phosphate isomerase [Chloroherpetonaceae bacterium]|nr:KpsF/GutQ family sugar-phosphate isomerase [Chloroherpetonaceae bacterium]MDW8438203.1 KpsF/GutQ family sugar-phosphate isomerase [Chloroherpetonaceae bacterium]
MTPSSAETTAFQQVVELLRSEAKAIEECAARLNPVDVERAVSLICAAKGKVVALGVGKSGIIAQKIAATMTSTGTQAVAVHPTDAMHGDLGYVSSNDVALAISNSGETDELLALLPHLKHRGVPIVAIVGNLKSTLARKADAVLNATIQKEAGYLNLAPTTSASVALAIGDAIAMAVMRAKGINAEDFAINHPAGRLGKRLTLRVEDLMHSGRDNPTVSPASSWIEVIGALTEKSLGAVNVVDGDGNLLGIITDGDVRRTVQRVKPADLERLTAEKMMTRNPITIAPERLAVEALDLMENRPSQISVLPVVSGKKCVGLIRIHDIARRGL